jgi:hypothetical protein
MTSREGRREGGQHAMAPRSISTMLARSSVTIVQLGAKQWRNREKTRHFGAIAKK